MNRMLKQPQQPPRAQIPGGVQSPAFPAGVRRRTGNRPIVMKQQDLGPNPSTRRARQAVFLDALEWIVPWAGVLNPRAGHSSTSQPLGRTAGRILFFDPLRRKSPRPTWMALLTCMVFAALLPLFAASLSIDPDPTVTQGAPTGLHAANTGVDSEMPSRGHGDSAVEIVRWGHHDGPSAMDHVHEPLFVPPEDGPFFCAFMPPWGRLNGILKTGTCMGVLERPPKPIAA